MVVCGRGPEQLLLPWRALGSYAAAATTTPESTVWQPTFGSSFATSAVANASILSNNNNSNSSIGSSMKRHLSDSDIDDVFDDTSSKGTPTQSNDSCQLMNRKKRRGIIEKRRRDRINSSLTELRRLVPTAFEKQGSAKLEKAEILQMTVDHLKMLHAKGFDAFSFDPHKFATDYHSIGFRECAAEVARYLVTVEGMDIQDPLRLRLMSHLQCYSAQRELAAKQATTWNAFSSVPAPPPTTTSTNSSQYPSSAATAPMMATGQPPHNSLHTHPHHPHPNQHHHHQTANGNNIGGGGGGDPSHNMSGGVHHPLSSLSCSEHPRLSDGGSSGGSTSGLSSHMRFGPTPPASTGNLQSVPTMPVGVTSSPSMIHHPIGHQMHSQYPVSININTHGFTSMSPSGYSPTSTTSQAGHSVKPYRPWGTELAY